MAGTVQTTALFEAAVRDFIKEQLMREPFCTVGALREQLSSLQERLGALKEKSNISFGRVEELENSMKTPGGGTGEVLPDSVESHLQNSPQETPVREGNISGHDGDVAVLLGRLHSQRDHLCNLLDAHEYDHTLENIRERLTSVLSSGSQRKKDETTMFNLKTQVEILRQASGGSPNPYGWSVFEELKRVVRNHTQLMQGTNGSLVQTISATLRDHPVRQVITTIVVDHLSDVYRQFGDLVQPERTARYARFQLSRVSRLEFSSQYMKHPSHLERQMRVVYKSAASGWIISAILAILWFLLILQRGSDTTGDASTSLAIPPPIPAPDNTPPAVGASRPDLTSLAPTQCFDECLEEEFWKALREGWA